jgi:thiosulfate sulfurtransferase
MSYKCINVDEARDLIEKDAAVVIDIRDPVSYDAGHIKDAQLIDDSNVEGFIQSGKYDCPLIICCYHGNMSKAAADYFNKKGFKETYSIDGGYVAWKQSHDDK